MSRTGKAGRAPGAKRAAKAGPRRSRAAAPPRTTTSENVPPRGRQTALTARAAVLVLAVASVMVAVALPLKIWLGQRSDISSLVSQTQQAQAKLGRLNAQDRRWQNPAYIESQARKRLHYTLPGQTTRVVLGTTSTGRHRTAARGAVASSVPWYTQFWKSVETAGAPTSSR